MNIAVKKYLIGKKIKPKYIGFTYLEKAIILAMKQPSLSLQDLFSLSCSIPWESAYHSAHYALKKTNPNISVADFIHTAASEIEIGGNYGI